MDRRAFLVAAGSLCAGCAGGGGNGGDSEGDVDPTQTATTTATATPTPEPTSTQPPTSQFRGPTREDPQYVDVRYRDYTASEVETIRQNAQTMDYRALFRDIDTHVGAAVKYRATITQVLEGEGYFTFFLAIGNSIQQPAYASWVGDRYLTEDVVDIWAEVLGTESYQTGAGAQRTVPALSIAAMERVSTTSQA